MWYVKQFKEKNSNTFALFKYHIYHTIPFWYNSVNILTKSLTYGLQISAKFCPNSKVYNIIDRLLNVNRYTRPVPGFFGVYRGFFDFPKIGVQDVYRTCTAFFPGISRFFSKRYSCTRILENFSWEKKFQNNTVKLLITKRTKKLYFNFYINTKTRVLVYWN